MNKHGMHQGACCTPAHGVGFAGPGCCGGGFRRFYTEKEKREQLERYKAELEKELAAVEEHLKNP